MRRALPAFAVLLLATAAPARAACPVPPGDVTADGTTDLVDVQCLILTTLWARATPSASCRRASA